jgi:hypothetical protein
METRSATGTALCLALLLSIVAAASQGGQGTSKQDKPETATGKAILESPQPSDAANQATTDRIKLLNDLEQIIRNDKVQKDQRHRVVIALLLLGNLQAKEKTQLLLRFLDFHTSPDGANPGGIERADFNFDESYPALNSLIKIGSGANQEMLDYLASTSGLSFRYYELGSKFFVDANPKGIATTIVNAYASKLAGDRKKNFDAFLAVWNEGSNQPGKKK